MMSAALRIGDLARECEVTAKTIRYYEDLQILPKPDRGPSGYRRYGPADVARLQFIRKAKSLGLTLGEIAEILALQSSGEQPCNLVRDRLTEKIASIGEQIARLEAARANLRYLRDEAKAVDRAEGSDVCPIIDRQPVPLGGCVARPAHVK